MPSSTQAKPVVGEPYCGHCGYALTGLTDSPRCPECGRPLVEVLQRRGFGAGGTRGGKRYRSKATLFGLPVVDVAIGPYGDETFGRAKGIIAVGDMATGLLAVGGISFGLVAIGGLGVGCFAVGGGALALVAAMGGVAVSGGLAVGGCAIGTVASGGAGVGLIAQGGGALGKWVRDGATFGRRRPEPEIFRSLGWLFGGRGLGASSFLFPAFWAIISTAVAAAMVGLLALVGLRRSSPGDEDHRAAGVNRADAQ